jgi:hypothetical protein
MTNPQGDSDRSDGRVNHLELPAGTVLTIVSTMGNTFRVRLLEGLYHKHSRVVEVLEAPIDYDTSLGEPVTMCVVPPGTSVDMLGDAYSAYIPTVGQGDVVRLVNHNEAIGIPVSPFEVQSLQVG